MFVLLVNNYWQESERNMLMLELSPHRCSFSWLMQLKNQLKTCVACAGALVGDIVYSVSTCSLLRENAKRF